MRSTLSSQKYLIKLFIILLLGILTTGCHAQSKQDPILSKKVRDMKPQDMTALEKTGYVKQLDIMMMGTYLLEKARKDTSINDWTIKQVLDSVKERMNMMAIKKNNYGKDSVFIRRPDGGKMFIGMGQLSLEKIIARESKNLPTKYHGDANLNIATTEGAVKASQMAPNDLEWLYGSILLIDRDNGSITNLKIGDLLEITKRVSIAPEFASFMKQMADKN